MRPTFFLLFFLCFLYYFMLCRHLKCRSYWQKQYTCVNQSDNSCLTVFNKIWQIVLQAVLRWKSITYTFRDKKKWRFTKSCAIRLSNQNIFKLCQKSHSSIYNKFIILLYVIRISAWIRKIRKNIIIVAILIIVINCCICSLSRIIKNHWNYCV